MRNFIAALLLSLATLPLAARAADAPPTAKATTFSADLTGLWLVNGEAGWGVDIVQQMDVLFVTLFVFDQAGNPTWMFGSKVEFAGTDTQGAFVFTGQLYSGRGSWFGGQWNPNPPLPTDIGEITLRLSGYNQIQMSYVANGTPVQKTLVPYAFRVNDLNGTYRAVSVTSNGQCNIPVQTPTSGMQLQVTHTSTAPGGPTNAVFRFTDGSNSTCTFTGAVANVGKLVDIDGTYTCTTGSSGNFTMRRIDAGVDGMVGIINSMTNRPSCSSVFITFAAGRSN